MSHGHVLVTGGAGFIGSHVVQALLREGRRVRVLDNLELPTHRVPPQLPAGAEFLRGDVRAPDDLERALRGVDAVVHLAATGGFTADSTRYLDVNSIGTARLLEVARRRGVGKLVVASSVGIYGEGAYRCARHGEQAPAMRAVERLEKSEWEVPCPACGEPLEPLPTPERKPAAPAHPYSISKFDEERLVLSSGLPSVALRFFLCYGPRQSLTNPYTGVASIFSGRVLNDLPPLVYEDGRQTRDFVFVDDVVRAVLLALDGTASGVYNVGTGTGTSIADLARLLARCYGRDLEPELPGFYRSGEARHIVADASALRALGWRPQVSLEEGLERYAEWVLEQGGLRDEIGAALPQLLQTGVVRGGEQPPEPREDGLSVIIPAYNEAGNLESLVRHALAELPAITERFEVLIVDDGSRDGTTALADRLAGEDERIRVIHHPFNIGFGGAQKSGFKGAHQEWVVVVPADHQFDVGDLRLFWERRHGYDLIASRRTRRDDPWSRRVVSRVYNSMMRLVYGIPLRDINWVKMWRRRLFDQIDVESRGFGVDAEIVAKARRLGYRIGEVDVPHYPRTWGAQTSIRLRTLYLTGRELLRIGPMLRKHPPVGPRPSGSGLDARQQP